MPIALLLAAAMLAGGTAPAEADAPVLCGGWPGWEHDEFPDVDTFVRIVIVGADEVRVNGSSSSREQVPRLLADAGRASRPPALIFEFGPEADCALVRELREAIARAIPCDRGLCSEIHDITTGPPPTEADIARQIAQAKADLDAAIAEVAAAAKEPDRPERR